MTFIYITEVIMLLINLYFSFFKNLIWRILVCIYRWMTPTPFTSDVITRTSYQWLMAIQFFKLFFALKSQYIKPCLTYCLGYLICPFGLIWHAKKVLHINSLLLFWHDRLVIYYKISEFIWQENLLSYYEFCYSTLFMVFLI